MAGFITRPFACKHKHGHCTQYVVWGGTRQKLILYRMELSELAGITPHIISYKEVRDNNINIAITCGVIGCGIDFKNPEDKTKGIIINEVRNFLIPESDWNALLNFTNTGYELSKFKRNSYYSGMSGNGSNED